VDGSESGLFGGESAEKEKSVLQAYRIAESTLTRCRKWRCRSQRSVHRLRVSKAKEEGSRNEGSPSTGRGGRGSEEIGGCINEGLGGEGERGGKVM
jgi:hypothetical protein